MLNMNILDILKEMSSDSVKHNTIYNPVDKNESQIIYYYGKLYFYFNYFDENEMIEMDISDVIFLAEKNVKYNKEK